jgi:hypothetical protein
MKMLKQSLIGAAGLVVLAAVMGLMISPATRAQVAEKIKTGVMSVLIVNTPSEPVPIAGTVTVGNAVQTQTLIPAGAFTETNSFSPNGLTMVFSGPDPEGTSYAVTSLTVSNPSFNLISVRLLGSWGPTGDCITFSSGLYTTDAGPIVYVPPGETVHLAFPQPLIFPAQSGAASCLTTIGSASADTTVAGYRF